MLLGEGIMVPVLLVLMEDMFLLFIDLIMEEDLVGGTPRYLVALVVEVLVMTEMRMAPSMDLLLLLPKLPEAAVGSTQQPLWRIQQQNSCPGCFSCSVASSYFACFCSERSVNEMKLTDFIFDLSP